MLLKPDRTGRFDRLDREPVTAPIREEAKNRWSQEPVKNWSEPARTGVNRWNRWTGDGSGKPDGSVFSLKKNQNFQIFFLSFFFSFLFIFIEIETNEHAWRWSETQEQVNKKRKLTWKKKMSNIKISINYLDLHLS